MSNEFKIAVDSEGNLQFIHDDLLTAMLKRLGETTIQRVSNVEPNGTTWTPDMSPVNGPTLGEFDTRQEALKAEVDWLTERLGEL